MGKWENWKQRNLQAQQEGRVTPAALLNPDTPKVDTVKSMTRFATCVGCPEFLPTKQCRKCGCFMPAKVKLEHAFCPLGKW
jgi:hypothetical protein